MTTESTDYWTLSEIEKLMELMGKHDICEIDLQGTKISRLPKIDMKDLPAHPLGDFKEPSNDMILYGQEFEEGDK